MGMQKLGPAGFKAVMGNSGFSPAWAVRGSTTLSATDLVELLPFWQDPDGSELTSMAVYV